jgi:hypothetical protein
MLNGAGAQPAGWASARSFEDCGNGLFKAPIPSGDRDKIVTLTR